MGSLILPPSGRVYLDSNCIIYSVEKFEPYCRVLENVWQAAEPGSIEIVSSELTFLETLVKPVRESNKLIENLFRELLLESGSVKLMPITNKVLEQAISLRARDGLKTPDAIHAATALESGCKVIITNDSAFNRLNDISVLVLSEIASA